MTKDKADKYEKGQNLWVQWVQLGVEGVFSSLHVLLIRFHAGVSDDDIDKLTIGLNF